MIYPEMTYDVLFCQKCWYRRNPCQSSFGCLNIIGKEMEVENNEVL